MQFHRISCLHFFRQCGIQIFGAFIGIHISGERGEFLANPLYARGPELFAKAAQNISPAAERDLAEQREYSAKYTSGKAAQVSDKINDSFIKSQGVASGTASYSEVTKLILAYKESQK